MSANSPTNTVRADRAPRIIALHEEIAGHLKASFEKAVEIGKLLAEQKASLAHGAFTTWVRNHLPFTARTARNYMALYRARELLKTENVSDLTSAYRLVATVAKKERYHQGVPENAMPQPVDLGVDIQALIRKGLRALLQSACECADKEIATLEKQMAVARQLRTDICELIANADGCDLEETAATVEEMTDTARRARLNRIHLCLEFDVSHKLRKVLRDPTRALPCIPVVGSLFNGFPVWGCGTHDGCWTRAGFEAGPAETHVRGYALSDACQCSLCMTRESHLYQLVKDDRILCPACYFDFCLQVSGRNQEQANELLDRFEVAQEQVSVEAARAQLEAFCDELKTLNAEAL
jgi:hypothetical protein